MDLLGIPPIVWFPAVLSASTAILVGALSLLINGLLNRRFERMRHQQMRRDQVQEFRQSLLLSLQKGIAELYRLELLGHFQEHRRLANPDAKIESRIEADLLLTVASELRNQIDLLDDKNARDFSLIVVDKIIGTGLKDFEADKTRSDMLGEIEVLRKILGEYIRSQFYKAS